MTQIVLTDASLHDLATIQVIGRETFRETFADSNTETDMNQYLDENFGEQRLRSELSNPESFFFIAWDGVIPVGYMKVNMGNAQTELQDDSALEIERIYVKSSHHGKMVGQLLYNKALTIARHRNKIYLWLGVWEENPRAIRFYEKNGFVAFDKHLFKMGNDEQTDIMMKKVIIPDCSIQPQLINEQVVLFPLKETDFESLYTVASDPKIWEQHPNKDRWKKAEFLNFFDGAMKSGGAFKIVNKASGTVIGSTRFYDYDPAENSILIGYTFYDTRYWGKGVNLSVKKLMLDYIFRFVSKVYFHIGVENIRSQIAISRLGAVKIAELDLAYFGETPKRNFVYVIQQHSWLEMV